MKLPVSGVASLVLSLFGLGEVTLAQQSQPVVRRVAFWNLELEGFPDFLSDQSLAVIAVGGPLRLFDDDVYTFAHDDEGNPVISRWLPFNGRHLTVGGTTYEGVFLWEETPDTPTAPPVGSFTFTGPDGLIIETAGYTSTICAGSDCTTQARELGAWHLHPIVPGETPRFIILEAVFSR